VDDRPNFLVFVAEHHRGDCLGIEGHPVLLTPNMDGIAGAGTRFTACHTSCPTCMPARRSLLSGQFPVTHGLLRNTPGLEWDAPPTLPGILSAAGYQTWWIGRDHHQYPKRKRYGFDHMVIGADYSEWLERVGPEGNGGYRGSGIMHNDKTARPWHLDETLHHTHWTINQALEFLRKRDPSCPFLLVVSFIAAHQPMTPPAFYMERYLRMDLPAPVIGDWATPPQNGGLGNDVATENTLLAGEELRCYLAGYFGLLNHLDDQIRRLLNPVNGIDRMTGSNTVVVYTADHGEMLGDHYLIRKRLPYEGATRIPLLIRGPKRLGLKKGQTVGKPVGLEDIMPTLLEMAGADIPETVEGQSLLPLLRGEDVPWRPYSHIENSPRFHALTDGKEKYAWFTEDGREQFFDLAADPTECHDLMDNPRYADRVDEWRRRLIIELTGRPEGFTDGKHLMPGRPYPPVMPHARGYSSR